jgi:hypothetical protein
MKQELNFNLSCVDLYRFQRTVAAGSEWKSINADSSGNWTANFQPYDIKPGDNGFALVFSNPSGYHIQYEWNVLGLSDTDFDGIDDSIDNAPNVFNPDQRDIDNDGNADVIDPCPSDPTDTCNESGSTSVAVSSEGGTLIPPNNAIAVELPAGALTETTSMSITDKGSGYAVTTDQGQVVTVNSAEIGPAGTQFVIPITITFNWLDEDNDGIVDGTFIKEDDLIISKNGEVIAGPCKLSENCDNVLNTYSVQVSSLSYFVLGGSGGFVTGGGWINSPSGAYTKDPSKVGKLTFGFSSQYKKGANIPTGNTELQFQNAKLRFYSTSYDWLVVTENKAQFQGKGTINGSGNYGFMVTVVDGQTDRFRIKIWNISTSAIIYDNMPGVSEGANQVTVLGGGSIVIHK